MPVQYRSFYVKKLTNIKEKEKSQYEKARGETEATPSQRIAKGPQLQR
jgi:hypothetical protein